MKVETVTLKSGNGDFLNHKHTGRVFHWYKSSWQGIRYVFWVLLHFETDIDIGYIFD